MGLFGGKKVSPEAQDLREAAESAVKGMSKRQLEEYRKKLAGEVSRKGDIKAGLKDLKEGRKGAQGVGKLPARPEGKGRSIFGPNTPIK